MDGAFSKLHSALLKYGLMASKKVLGSSPMREHQAVKSHTAHAGFKLCLDGFGSVRVAGILVIQRKEHRMRQELLWVHSSACTDC